MFGWLVSAAGAAGVDHISGRSSSWWTGENSIWGQLTGGGSDRDDSYNIDVETKRESNINPLLIVAAAYFFILK